MAMELSNKQRATFAGLLIIAAYTMLTYTITKNAPLGVATDILSGLAVIGIPLLMFPIFSRDETKTTNYLYMASRFIEGGLMIMGGVTILLPSLEGGREFIYERVHIYFFISGALFFYILLYQTQIVPRFISIWGLVATVLLLAVTIIQLFGVEYPVLMALVIPIVLNELFLAAWLMIKGFDLAAVNKITDHAAAV